MLELKNIVKDYITKDLTTHALKGISVNFRRNEFVSILGSSGCGKTTLLNIIGGLDRYTSGDLIIKGKSTKDFKDRDWDTYRNHSIGFIFQSYNLIMHQNLLSNVELALTIGGVDKKERRKRAEKALETVGLGGLGSKKPNQLSGGQMQRVAIARALVNDPEILLADEPTGALDSVTSIQVMDLLKEIAKDRLVIMVTHNPDLANQYSTRIIKLKDGLITDDSKPYSDQEASKEVYEEKVMSRKERRKSKMSFKTALQLSFNNLKTKKGRTILTAVAGSIGIIGIGMILAMSDGFNTYVQRVQSDSLSTLPIALKERDISLANIIAPGQKKDPDQGKYPKDQTVYTKDFLFDAVTRVLGTGNRNDLTSFKSFIESDEFKTKYSHLYNSIQYVYETDINLYKAAPTKELFHYEKTFDIDYTPLAGLDNMPAGIKEYLKTLSSKDIGVFSLLLNNQKVLDQQYDLLEGHYPIQPNEVLLRVDKYNRINDYVYYALGLKNMKSDVDYYNKTKGKTQEYTGSFQDILNLELKMPLNADLLRYDESQNLFFKYDETDPAQAKKKEEIINNSYTFKIAGIVRSKETASSGSISSALVYTDEFVKDMNKRAANTDYIQKQLTVGQKPDSEGKLYYPCLLDQSVHGGLVAEKKFYSKTDMEDYLSVNFGYGKQSSPSAIHIYPKSFAAKDELKNMIYDYNKKFDDQDPEQRKKQISYTDNLASVTQSLALVIDGVTMVLIGFVSISLVVSSVMIGIITYVSVIERTKEIGVLRSLGASKNNVGNVFNAETFIIGLTSGGIGVLIAIIGIIPINIAIATMANIKNLAFLSWYYALALIGISVLLTVIAGLVPARIASNKDPVIALRSGE